MVLINGQYPNYLEAVLSRAQLYKEHLIKLLVKIKTHHNIIAKLSGPSCRADSNTLGICVL